LKQFVTLVALGLLVSVSGCGGGGAGGGSKGAIVGTVRNSEGTPLPGATVSAGGVRTTTNNDGDFRLENVPAGTQIVSAALSGYFDDGRGSASVLVVDGQTVYLQNDLILVPKVDSWVYLRSLDPSSTNFRGEPQQRLGGTVYFHCLAGGYWDWYGDALEAIYSVGRRYSRFNAVVGVSDMEPNLNAEVIFTVIGDGNVLYRSQRLKVGRIETIDIDVSNILTLQLQVTRVDDVYPSVVWADPRLKTK